jgi:lipopolysaccharide biosynthesis glycosyltransferase
MKKEKAICFCFDKNYAKYCQVALLSLFLNCRKSFRVYILYIDGVEIEDIEAISNLCKKFNTSVAFFKVDSSRISRFKVNNYYTTSVYSRLLIPELLANEDIVLYLDCDIIVNKNIDEIFIMDIDEYKYCAVFDKGASEKSLLPDYIKRKYINSGVLLMNLKKLREDDSFSKMMDLYGKHHNLIIYPDQCLINLYASNEIKLIDEKFNRQIIIHDTPKEAWNSFLQKTIIFHFITGTKPWHKHARLHISDFWWSYAHLLNNKKIKCLESNLIYDLIKESKSLEEVYRFEESCKVKDKIIYGLLYHKAKVK